MLCIILLSCNSIRFEWTERIPYYWDSNPINRTMFNSLIDSPNNLYGEGYIQEQNRGKGINSFYAIAVYISRNNNSIGLFIHR